MNNLNKHRILYCISFVLTILFAWIVFLIKWTKKIAYNARKRRAIKDAFKQSKSTSAIVYVVQWHDRFFVGKRHELRREIDKRYGKVVRGISHVLDVDFKRAVIARFQQGREILNEENECK